MEQEQQPEPPDRRIVADAVSLALASSKLITTIDPDALEAAIYIDAGDIVRDGVVNLQVAWNIARDLEGFDPAAARAPFALLKSWEDKFAAPVALPAELASLSERDIALAKGECRPNGNDISRAFEPPEVRAARTAALNDATTASTFVIPKAVEDSWRTRPEVAYAAATVLAMAVGFIGFTIWTHMRHEPEWTGLDVTAFASGIPLSGARVFGDQVGAQLSSDAWLTTPAEQRADQMEMAFRRIPSEDPQVLFVNDSTGKMRATAQWYGMPPKVRVRFYP